MRFRSLVATSLFLLSCASPSHALRAHAPPMHAAPPISTTTTSSAQVAVAAPAPTPAPHASFASWLKSRLPAGGEIVDKPGEGVDVVHTVRAGDTVESVAAAYLDVTSVYFATDLAAQIAKQNNTGKRALKADTKLTIPGVLTEAYKTGDAERLPHLEDKTMRGFYVRGATAARTMFPSMLERMADRGINLIVLDAKDYDGFVTYPTKVALANEAGAVKHPPIRDLARTIRFAHDKGIRVAMRIASFEDEIMAKAKRNLSVQSKWGRAYPIGWLDPSNEGAQAYVIDLVKESLDAGADEIQLDYVRYPVLGIKGADFHLKERGLTQTTVIRDFVRKVHAVTKARNVPLSLDVFGVIAFGARVDIDALGQDPVLLAPECEALAPMVYPSHYAKGFHGWDEPGDHPEIVGIGTKAIRAQIDDAGIKGGAVIRPWLQAMNWKSPAYSPGYLATEIKSGDAAGGVGWLMWNPGQDYSYAWQAVPKRRVAN
ncbi:MAG: putative glycoside hydrolase [Polyangiaceae bacterium]